MIQPICYSKLNKSFNKTGSELPPIGIIPKEREQVDQCNMTCEIDVTSSIIDLGLVMIIYKEAIRKLQLSKTVAQMGLQKLTKSVKNFVSYKQLQTQSIPWHTISESSVNETLRVNGLRCVPVIGDGNCFFKAMAINLESDKTRWHQAFSLIGITPGTDYNISEKLRVAFVKEILGERRPQYEEFLGPIVDDFEKDANKFLEANFYDSPIGNAMPLALATALRCSIVIYTTDTKRPPMYISPDIVTTIATAFVIYEPQGPGHYDAALPYAVNDTRLDSNEIHRPCRCGSNKTNISTASCFKNPFYCSS